MRILFFFVFVFISAQSFANPPFANIFTRDIYKAPPEHLSTPSFRTSYLKFQKLSQIKTKKIDLIDKEIDKLLDIVIKADKEKIPLKIGAAAALGAIELGAIVGRSFLSIFNERTRVLPCDENDDYIMTKISSKIVSTVVQKRLEAEAEIKKLDAKKEALQKEEGVSKGPIWELERAYVQKKHLFAKTWQDKIENLLINAYDHEEFYDKQLIEDLINYSFDPKTFSNADVTNLNLDQLDPTSFEYTLLSQMVDEDTCPVYGYCQTDNQDAFETKMRNIAQRLGLPIFVLNAQGKTLNKALLEGTKEYKGLFLTALSNDKNLSNPIIVIKNLDQWTRPGAHNLQLLNDVFDAEELSFDSAYFGLPVECTHVHIIGAGSTSIDELDDAFQDRVDSYIGIN